MAKSAFDDNVPRLRPRLRLGKALADIDTPTEAPPVRAQQSLDIEPAPVDDVSSRPPEAAPAVVVEPPDQLLFHAEELSAIAGPVSVPPIEPAGTADLQTPSERPAHAAVPAVGTADAIPQEVETSFSAVLSEIPTTSEPLPTPVELPAPREQPPAPDVSAEDSTRRSSLRRRAAGLGALTPETRTTPASSILDDLDALESTAQLASELQRALDAAAEANESLRRDLSAALDDLARSTADSKRVGERTDRLEAEARDRSTVVHDLVREMELLEAERDSALVQSSDAQLEVEGQAEKMLLLERRTSELERGLADAQARTKRFEEAAQAHATQRAALRAELDAIRHERDSLLARNAELEREREDLTRSRKALDEVHRALSEARSRAQRIRPR